MDKPEIYIRQNRTVAVAHGEAFQLMLYREVEGPGEAWYWNSRDGVTPFGTSIDGKQYRHAMSGYATRYTAVLPPEAQHVWISYTRETWEKMMRDRYAHFAAQPDDQAYGGADFSKRYRSVGAWLKVSPFEHGSPRQVTRAEFLELTNEWMGKADGR